MSRTLLLVRELIAGDELSDGEIAHRFASVRVRLISDQCNLSCANGQTALVTALNLIVRLGVTVSLDIPDAPLCASQPPITGSDLRSALNQFSRDVFPAYSPASEGDDAVDIAILIGDSPWTGTARVAWRLWGDAWTGAISPLSDTVPCWQGDFPMGALASAAMVAPEVFKYALRGLGVQPATGRQQFIEPVHSAIHSIETDAPSTVSEQEVRVDFVSAGAITNAVLYTLFRVPGLRVKARVIDADDFEASNQNRYVLALWHHMARPKVEVTAAQAPLGWEIRSVRQYYSPDTAGAIVPLADHVMIGADQIEARWWVQSQWPAWFGVGSTSHFDIVVSEHSPGQPCAGCLHHKTDDGEGPIPTISFVSFWSGLLVAARFVRHLMGVSVDSRKQQTYLSPLRLDDTNSRMDAGVFSHPECPVEHPTAYHRA